MQAGLAEDGALDVVGSGLGLLEGDVLGATPVMGQKERTERVSSPALANARDSGEPLLRYATAFLRVPVQEDTIGKSSRTSGLGQAGPVLQKYDRAVGVSEGVGVFVCEVGRWGDRRMDVRLRRILGGDG